MMLTIDNDDMLQTIRPSMVLKKKSDRLHQVADLQFESVGWDSHSWPVKLNE